MKETLRRLSSAGKVTVVGKIFRQRLVRGLDRAGTAPYRKLGKHLQH